MFGVALVGFGFFGANDDARREKFGVKHFGEFESLSVFAGHWQAEDVDRASAEPGFDCRDFIFHKLIIA